MRTKAGTDRSQWLQRLQILVAVVTVVALAVVAWAQTH